MGPEKAALQQEMDRRVELSDEAFETAEAKNIASNRGENQRRSVFEGNGQYEFATTRHYVPRYWRDAGRNRVE